MKFFLPIVTAVLVFLASGQTSFAASTESDIVILAGQLTDIAPSAYQYRADRKAGENPPETVFLFSAIEHEKARTLCGLLWEEPRPVKQVVLRWPSDAKAIPKPDAVALQWCPSARSASWWCRSEEGKKPRKADSPKVSDDGRQYIYTLEATSNDDALDNLAVILTDEANSPKTLDVPMIEVIAPQTWKPMELFVEWGFQEGTEQKDFDGRIEAYNGLLGEVKPLENGQATKITAADAWESRPSGTARRGVVLKLLYCGYQDSAVWPGQANIDDVNRTIVTVRTKSGSFSFLPADLEKGPILAPEFGFFVAKTADNATAAQFRKELEAKGLKTLREQIHSRPEQTWNNAMRAVHTDIQGEFPPFPQPAVSAPMTVETPNPYLTAAWKIGATNMLRGAKKDERGKWCFRDPPYDALAHETQLLMRILDLMGMHREARDGYEMWLDRMDEPVPPPQGVWVGGPGKLFSGIEWDNAHSGGVSLIHLAMLEHYRLTNDRDWLAKNAAKLNANADWMIEQRKRFSDAIPGREKLWADGLLPPHNIWDNEVWRSWYESNASYCHAIARHAEVIAEIDPEAGKRYAEEGKVYREALLKAVEKSITLSPVICVRDGTYRSFIPAAPYMRGPASRFMPTNFSAPGVPMHSPGLYADAIRGGQYLVEFGILPAGDVRVQGYLDVLEDRLLSENFKIPLRFKDYGSRKDWFDRAGWYYQCGLERTADIHLRWDDPACFLRSLWNQYAAEILPGVWNFKEHTTEHPVMDKPFEEAAFLVRFRNMLVQEKGDCLLLAQAAPREWFEQGKKFAVKNAPTAFGAAGYEIVSDAERKKISATVEVPSRNPPKTVVLRLRHPQSAEMKGVTVNGQAWKDFDAAKETIRLQGLQGTVKLEAAY
jgi:hypothetical protein